MLRGDRDASPNDRARLSLRLAELLRGVDQTQAASELLAACERELSRAKPELVALELREAVADQSFAALRELDKDGRALAVALDQAARLWPEASDPATAEPAVARRLGAWLARAARVLDAAGVDDLDQFIELDQPDQLVQLVQAGLPETLPRARVGLFEAAVELRPNDLELADMFEQMLRGRDDHQGVALHLRRQVDRNADPELRASLLERLIAELEHTPTEQLQADSTRDLPELLEDLLALRPQHTAAMLTLARLRFAAGEASEARQLWVVADGYLEPDDPRFFRPALELARDAIESGEPHQARILAERARALRPEDPEALALLGEVARALDDPRLAAEVLGQRLALGDTDTDTGTDTAALELARAAALERLFERDGDRQLAAQAIEHYAAAELLWPSRERQQDRSATTRRWLALALALADLEHQARARAVLRETIGDELEISELLAEVELLDRQLERPLAALERLESALGQREADPELLARLGELLAARADDIELAQRGQRILRGLLQELGAGPGRTQAAELLVQIGAALDDPASVAFALDQIEPERVEQGELARLREWAIRKLGRVQEEIGSVESR